MDSQYLAGFFDGEGCVYVHAGKYVRINITNNHKRTLERIQAEVGGKLYGPYARSGAIQLILAHRVDVTEFLRTVQPHCISKAAQVNAALEYLDNGGSAVELDQLLRILKKDYT